MRSVERFPYSRELEQWILEPIGFVEERNNRVSVPRDINLPADAASAIRLRWRQTFNFMRHRYSASIPILAQSSRYAACLSATFFEAKRR